MAVGRGLRTEIEAQNSKSGFMRNYSRAIELLAQAQQGFQTALNDSMAAMAKVKSEAEQKGAGASAAIEEVKVALEGVRKSNKNRERWRQEIESNCVEVYLHHLRRKLDHDLIRNVRGVGYRLALLE